MAVVTAADFAVGAFAVAALVLPGWIAARKAHVPQPVAAGFIAGAVVLHAIVLACDALRIPLQILPLAGIWGALTAAALLWRRRGRAPSARPEFNLVAFSRANWPLLLPLVPAAFVVGWRAVTQPLYGLDTIFRWNWLAEQMLARGHLGFYPPVSEADYTIYGWPDGIAPVVSTLYFWCYAVAGEARTTLTAPVVLLQCVLLAVLTAACARRWLSDRAAAFALALLAGSPVVLWATAMGQETGLTAIALIAMLFWLPTERAKESTPALLAAGFAAALGGLAREYGLVWIALGFGIAVWRRLSPRALSTFLLPATLGALPWYVRNYVLTGNPLFNLHLAGLFPTNEVHGWLMACYIDEFGIRSVSADDLRLLATNTLAGIAALGAGFFLGRGRSRELLLAAGIVGVLWLTSLRYTAAGFVNSLRVLAPALVCGAVVGGAFAARFVPGRKHLAGASIALALFGVDAALRALTLPANVYRYSPDTWLEVGGAVHAYHAHPVFGELARVTSDRRVLVLGPDALLTKLGARTVPPWSPEVAFLFDPAMDAGECTRLLAAAEIGYVLLKKADVNEPFLARSPFLARRNETLQPWWSDEEHELFRVRAAFSPR